MSLIIGTLVGFAYFALLILAGLWALRPSRPKYAGRHRSIVEAVTETVSDTLTHLSHADRAWLDILRAANFDRREVRCSSLDSRSPSSPPPPSQPPRRP